MWFYMSPLKFKFEFKSKRNDDHRADSLFPNSVIVLSCILAFFQIRTYVRNPALRSTTSFKHFLLLELFCKIGQSHKEWTQNTFFQGICREDSDADIARKLGDDRSLPVVAEKREKLFKSGSRNLKFPAHPKFHKYVSPKFSFKTVSSKVVSAG